MTKDFFKINFAPFIPDVPGIYKYYDSAKKLLYVGKAKNLKKRVTSYFTKEHELQRTNLLVSQIVEIEWTATETEHDAFLLENSLIKHFKPKYNILLKDDKTYPYVVIKKEPFSRVFLTRNVFKDGSEYIGPFTNVGAVYELIRLIKQNIPLRTCNLNLTPKNISSNKFKPCLEYHIGNCKAPCAGLQTEEDYNNQLVFIKQILKGNTQPIIAQLKQEMYNFAEAMQYENAAIVKQKIVAISNFESKNSVLSKTVRNVDVVSIVKDDQLAFVNYLVLVEGKMIHSKNTIIETKMNESFSDILSYVVSVLHPKFGSKAIEIIAPFEMFTEDKNLKITIPKSGDKKKLLDLSFKNVELYLDEFKKKKALLISEKSEEQQLKVLEQLRDDLELQELPIHIECFDNSNFQGSAPVAAMVCFKNGTPSKNDYRKFHIKTVEGINDFASMAEIVKRRYKRLSDENKPLPQLVIIDGGKGQLNAATKSIEELGLTGRMTIIGLAKREENIFFPNDTQPIQLGFNSSSLLLIRKIRDEVHRFGITFHRKIRSKQTIKNELEQIPGIGQKTAQTLLQTFRSVNKIKQLSVEELTKVIDNNKARIIFDFYFKK